MVEIEEVDENKDTQEKGDKQPDAPAAPAAPELKASQILPMVVMLGLQKFNLEEMGYVRHVEALFVLVQVVCLGLLYFVYTKINAVVDGGKKIKIPEQKQFGQVVKPATEQTPKEYDMEKWKEQTKQAVLGVCILGGVYCKWGYLMPLVLQVLMTPCQLYESPLFQMHALNKTVARPFPTPNPFGLPSAPTPQAEEVEEVKDKDEPKKEDEPPIALPGPEAEDKKDQ